MINKYVIESIINEKGLFMERITLDCIVIKKLFDRFDYEIDLRNGEDYIY